MIIYRLQNVQVFVSIICSFVAYSFHGCRLSRGIILHDIRLKLRRKGLRWILVVSVVSQIRPDSVNLRIDASCSETEA